MEQWRLTSDQCWVKFLLVHRCRARRSCASLLFLFAIVLGLRIFQPSTPYILVSFTGIGIFVVLEVEAESVDGVPFRGIAGAGIGEDWCIGVGRRSLEFARIVVEK